MLSTRTTQIAYWGSTILLLLPTAGTGLPELVTNGPASTVQVMHVLGYPLYIMKITGVAKFLGAIPLLVNRPERLVEWAYAGFTFLLLGAAASHIYAGDAARAPVPLICLLLLALSYTLRPKVRKIVNQQVNDVGTPFGEHFATTCVVVASPFRLDEKNA